MGFRPKERAYRTHFNGLCRSLRARLTVPSSGIQGYPGDRQKDHNLQEFGKPGFFCQSMSIVDLFGLRDILTNIDHPTLEYPKVEDGLFKGLAMKTFPIHTSYYLIYPVPFR